MVLDVYIIIMARLTRQPERPGLGEPRPGARDQCIASGNISWPSTTTRAKTRLVSAMPFEQLGPQAGRRPGPARPVGPAGQPLRLRSWARAGPSCDA